MQIGPIAPVQGMQRATEQLDRAAATMASPQPQAARGSDPSPAPPTGNQGLTAAQASGDLESAMADAIQASRAYEANARALEQNDTIQRRAISLGA
ncbi:flagellar basal body rod C-terminal domain-containing protein [Roseomonas sp. CAU 1739]|uniref:flagellar basal body rod C-terminal domain-containing protein n=1 Tax=Roseomonas sp. CAU 1739 TaxID=3140364 RepID=UPI00325C2D86